MNSETWAHLESYQLWKDFGQFPNGLPLLDQEASFVDAVRVFEHERKAVEGDDHPLTLRDLISILPEKK